MKKEETKQRDERTADFAVSKTKIQERCYSVLLGDT
jgi:hypothetical protein